MLNNQVNLNSNSVPSAQKEISNLWKYKEDFENSQLKIRELEDRSEQLIQLQKFAQGIAHDFGNIAQSMNGFVELLFGEIESQKGRLILDNLQVSTRRALNISKKISEIARIQVLQNRRFHLIELLDANQNLFSEIVSSSVNLKVVIDDDISDLVYGNPEQIERIIINIIENANHAIHGNGTIEIHCFSDEIENRLIIEISNDGPAIPKHIANKIFMPFVTTKSEGGTGLGLFLAYEYLNSCGGSIILQNRNHEVTFRIALPRSPLDGTLNVN